MYIQSWTELVLGSLSALWASVASFLPSLIGALIVLLIGLIFAAVIRSLIHRLIDSIRLDTLLKSSGAEMYFERAGLKLSSGKFFGLLVYWFILIVFVLAAADILGLYGLSLFLRSVVAYLPSVFVAVLIMLAAVLIANFLRSLVRHSVVSARLHAAKFLGTLTWWTLVIFGFLTSLIQLGVAADIIRNIITGLVAMIALAGGIAFGLGGKDYAAHLLEKLRRATEGE